MNVNTESLKVAQNTGRPLNRTPGKTASAVLGMALLALGLLVPCAKAQTPVTEADTNFILAAAQGGMTEVKLGEVAGLQGTSEEVKNFGRMMVKDHSAINSDMKALAAKKGVTLPDALDAKHQAMLDKLTALTGSAFDDAYIDAMVKGHKKTAKTFKAEAAATKDADITAFLDKNLPVVEGHLKLITDMKK